jgi:hypothetical protein
MTREQKDLLLKDLCARLYTCNCINGTALTVALADEQPLEANQWLISNYDCYKDKFIVYNIVYASDVERLIDIDNIRPYLFPLSSMTEEQKKEYDSIIYHNIELHWERYYNVIDVDCYEELYDFYNKNHFDYRGLIPMGLAIDATDKNIY